ncbi:hypothetical protein [Candidatus Flexifilum breve]
MIVRYVGYYINSVPVRPRLDLGGVRQPQAGLADKLASTLVVKA